MNFLNILNFHLREIEALLPIIETYKRMVSNLDLNSSGSKSFVGSKQETEQPFQKIRYNRK